MIFQPGELELEVPQNVKDIIKKLNATVYTIEDHMTDRQTYKKFVDTFYDFIKAGFEFKELRHKEVTFKIRRDENKIHKMRLTRFIPNLMLLEAAVILDYIDQLDETYLLDMEHLSVSSLNNYFDEKVIEPNTECCDNRDINACLDDIIFNLSVISHDFNVLLAISINLEDLMRLSDTNPEFDSLLRYKVDEDEQPSVVESILDDNMKKQIQILTENENCLQPMFVAGTGLKDKQVREYMCNGGYKPDLFGNTIPIPINTNFLIGGLNSIQRYFVDAMGGRKSLIMSKTTMGKAGHFANMVVKLAAGVKFSKTTDDCGSFYPVPIEIIDYANDEDINDDKVLSGKELLKRLEGRYFFSDIRGEMRCITIDKIDELYDELKGKTIYLRSPITCASPDGVCPVCYGKLYNINKDLTSPGALSAIKLTMPVSQDVLSAKHLLTTISIFIQFNPEFNKFFKLIGSYIVLNEDMDEEEIFNHRLVMMEHDKDPGSEYDEENVYTDYFNKIYVENIKTGELIPIIEQHDNPLYIENSFFKLFSKEGDRYSINFEDIDEDSTLFLIEIKNNELTKPLYDIMDLLDRAGNSNRVDIHTVITTMCRLMFSSRIGLQSIHPEMIFHAMIRESDDILKRPNFRSLSPVDYQILTVKSSLEHHPSPIMGLSFQQLKRQFKNPETYRKRGKSVLDPFFQETY